jgi:hypothetical protein
VRDAGALHAEASRALDHSVVIGEAADAEGDDLPDLREEISTRCGSWRWQPARPSTRRGGPHRNRAELRRRLALGRGPVRAARCCLRRDRDVRRGHRQAGAVRPAVTVFSRIPEHPSAQIADGTPLSSDPGRSSAGPARSLVMGGKVLVRSRCRRRRSPGTGPARGGHGAQSYHPAHVVGVSWPEDQKG